VLASGLAYWLLRVRGAERVARPRESAELSRLAARVLAAIVDEQGIRERAPRPKLTAATVWSGSQSARAVVS